MMVEYIYSAQTIETHLNTESIASNILLSGMTKVKQINLGRLREENSSY